MPWSFELTNQDPADRIGEIMNMHDRVLTTGISRMTTLSFRLRVDHPYANTILSNVDKHLILVTDDRDVRRHNMIVVAADESADASGAYVQVTCADSFWRLARRHITGIWFWEGNPRTGINRVQALHETLYRAGNTHAHGVTFPPDTDNLAGMAAIPSQYTTGVGIVDLDIDPPGRNAADIITELATAFDGFEWLLLPTTPPYSKYRMGGGNTATNADWTLANMIAYASLGSGVTPTATFEYGMGQHNVVSYQRVRSSDGIANRIEWEQGDTVFTRSDTASITDRGAYIDTIPTTDINDQAALIALADEHIRIRKQPRETITFKPGKQFDFSRVPFFAHYNDALAGDYRLGDLVRFRAAHQGVNRIDTNLRVFGVELAWTPSGEIDPTITLVQEA